MASDSLPSDQPMGRVLPRPSVRPHAVAAMEDGLFERLFDDAALERLHGVVRLAPGVLTDAGEPEMAGALASAEVIVTCWGAPTFTAELLQRAPRLRAVVHVAGTVKHLVTPALWARGIVVSSGATVNARPVAEFTLAAILLANKRAFQLADRYAADRSAWEPSSVPDDVGNYRRVVGVVGASRIGRLVIEMLGPFDVDILVHDPFVSAGEAAGLGAELVDVDELCRRADVVTLHAPALPSTHHLIDGRRLGLLRDGATLVNTARGTLVDTDALTAELVSGRLAAVLDHTEPEVLPDDSPLYDLPNVFLTPHIAGSLGNELRRLGLAAVAEVERYVAGEPFVHAVGEADLDRLA